MSALESSATSLATDNERLKLALQRATTENEILRATTSNAHRLSIGSSIDGSDSSNNLRGLGPTPMSMSNGVGMPADTSAGSAVAAAQALLARNGSAVGLDGSGSGSSSGELASGESSDAAASADAASLATAAALFGGAGPAPNPFQGSLGRGSSFLPAAATWDLIQSHPLVKQGVVDIADVCEALRGTARCDGQGPVFREESVWTAVEGAKRGGGDELI